MKTGTGDVSLRTKTNRDAIAMKNISVEKARSAYFLNEAFFMITPPNNYKVTFSKNTVFQKYAFYLHICALLKRRFQKEKWRIER